jgi:hypothetical protein
MTCGRSAYTGSRPPIRGCSCSCSAGLGLRSRVLWLLADWVCLNRVGDNEPELFRLELPCNSDAPCVARSAVDECEAIRPVREDARLVASELVTNAVLHSGCVAGDTLELLASIGEDHVVISVHDPCVKGDTPRLRLEEDPTRGGYGLRVVQKIARRWGSDPSNGQRVWAELALQG